MKDSPTATIPDLPILPPTEIAQYRFDPVRYIVDKLGWWPWAGESEQPGQIEVLAAYADALRAQIEPDGALVRNRIRIEAGHTVGKTKLAAGIVNHFFDCFPPAIVYTYAPTW